MVCVTMQQNQNADDGYSIDRRTVLKTVGGTTAVAGLAASAGTGGAAPGAYTDESYNGRRYTKYVPTGYDGSEAVPLLLMLHGCTQGPDGFKDETAMNEVAESNDFIVVYPEQTTGIYDCWQWFNDANSTRGNGEAAELTGIVDQEKSTENIDAKRVYVAGFSAGGAFVPNLLVEYADVFAAGGIHSGTMYDIAETQSDGNLVLTDCSRGPTPTQEGEHAYNRMEQFGITSPCPTIVFHGTNDNTVYPCHADKAVTQAAVTNDLALDGADDDGVDDTADVTATGSGPSRSYTRSEYHDPDGNAIIEEYIVDGMGHAWSGGTQGGSYTDPGGPDASARIWEFFTRWTLDGRAGSGNTAPTASASASPTTASPGETVSFDGTGSTDADGSITSYDWEFGDGTTATGSTPTHSYDAAGDYTATLTVTDDDGATATDSVTVSVTDGSNAAPTADASASPTSVSTGETVSFDGSGSSDSDGSLTSYDWDFGDGTSGTGQTVSHSYDAAGDYTATLTVTDDDGATATDSVTISVSSFSGYCGTEDNYTHVQQGRAYAPGDGYAYAEGSDERMGLYNTYYTTTLKETSAGYFEIVDSC